MKLAQLLRSSRDSSLTVNQWAEMFGFTFNGLTYNQDAYSSYVGGSNQPQAGEVVGQNFRGYADALYKTNGVVFACMAVRQRVFSEARFQFRQRVNGRPGRLFGTKALAPLEIPWQRGTTADLLARMVSDVDLAGNFFGAGRAGAIRRLRPDWVTIVNGSRTGSPIDTEVVGYTYQEGGPLSGNDIEVLLPEQVAHFAPVPDPCSRFRGMSWLSPIIDEVMADKSATRHKRQFFDGGAQLGYVVTMDAEGKMDETAFKRWVKLFKSQHEGLENAYRTLFLTRGADVKVVGADLAQIDFTKVQGHGETRVCAAAGVPPIVAGMSEGLEASTYCLPYDGSVWTVEGPRAIGDLRPGAMVWTRVEGQLQPGRVVRQGRTGTAEVFTIKTKNRSFRATGNHPVLTADGSWRTVSALTVGDRVIQPLGLPDLGGDRLPDGEEATGDHLQWLGAYTGDGCSTDRGAVTMCMPVADRARATYEALARRLFTKNRSGHWQAPGRRATDGHTDEMVALRRRGMSYRQIRDEMGLTIHPMSVRDRVHHATRQYVSVHEPIHIAPCRNGFRFQSVAAAAWHHAMGVTGRAATKRVPGWVYGLREDLRLAYLAGIVDSDGSVGKDGRLVIHFANRALVEDIKMLCVSCGIQCSNIATYQYTADVLPNPGTASVYIAWRFTVSSAVDVARVPFSDPLYRERVNANTHRHRPNKTGTYRICRIERGPVEPVYDIEVEDGHSFLADGVVVHNSNYAQARRAFADMTLRPLWRNAASSLASLISVPSGAELWYDDTDIPFLQEDMQDEAKIQQMQAAAIRQLVDSGYTPESVVAAVTAGDLSLLEHSGLYSVQLQPAGSTVTPFAGSNPVPVVGASANGRQLLAQLTE